jgi:hypothetical protein
VSYALETAGDASADLRDLEPWLGEEFLDELDKLIKDPSILRVYPDGIAIHEFERIKSEIRHIVFMKLRVDHQRKIVTLVAVRDQPMPRV